MSRRVEPKSPTLARAKTVSATELRQQDGRQFPKSEKLPSKGAPSPRINHAVASLKTQIFVFGGEVPIRKDSKSDTILLNDFYTFDSRDGQAWTEIKPAGAWPDRRQGASLVALNGKLYLFGGGASLGSTNGSKEGGSDVIYFNDVWSFDPRTQSWEEIDTNKESESKPTGRCRHTAIPVNDCSFCVFGGFGCHEDNDMWCFDVVASEWQKIEADKPKPVRRYGHLCAFADDTLWIWGGQTKSKLCGGEILRFNFGTKTWDTLDLPNAPTNRVGISGGQLNTYHWIIHGGSSGNGGRSCNTLSVFHLKTEKWRSLAQWAPQMPSLEEHKMLTVEGSIPAIHSLAMIGGHYETGSAQPQHNQSGMRIDFGIHPRLAIGKLDDAYLTPYLKECMLACTETADERAKEHAADLAREMAAKLAEEATDLLRRKVEELEDSLRAANARLSSADERLRLANEKHAADCEALKKVETELEKELGSLRAKEEKQTRKMVKLDESLAKAQKRLEKSEEEAAAKIEGLEAKLEDLRKKRGADDAAWENLRGNVKSLSAERDGLREERDALKAEKKAWEAEREKLQEQMKVSTEEMKASMEDSDAQMEIMETRFESMAEELELTNQRLLKFEDIASRCINLLKNFCPQAQTLISLYDFKDDTGEDDAAPESEVPPPQPTAATALTFAVASSTFQGSLLATNVRGDQPSHDKTKVVPTGEVSASPLSNFHVSHSPQDESDRILDSSDEGEQGRDPPSLLSPASNVGLLLSDDYQEKENDNQARSPTRKPASSPKLISYKPGSPICSGLKVSSAKPTSPKLASPKGTSHKLSSPKLSSPKLSTLTPTAARTSPKELSPQLLPSSPKKSGSTSPQRSPKTKLSPDSPTKRKVELSPKLVESGKNKRPATPSTGAQSKGLSPV